MSTISAVPGDSRFEYETGNESEEPPSSSLSLLQRAQTVLADAEVLDLIATPFNIYGAMLRIALQLQGARRSTSMHFASREELGLIVLAGVAKLRLENLSTTSHREAFDRLGMSEDMQVRLTAGTLTIRQVLQENPNLILGHLA